MTQEVQPLTWQKRTNLEEHQQFFSKINEIIANLAPTVNEAEAAIAQATQAIATANAASASADAASQQAQTAANTVAGYDGRLTAVEAQAATNKSDIEQRVKLSADHIQTITGGLDLRGTNTSPNTTVGEDDSVIANGHRIVQELNAYSQMVRTTGNQVISGEKEFLNNMYSDSFIINRTHDSRVPSTNKVFQIEVNSNDGYTHYIAFNNGADGSRSINIVMYVSETDVCYFNLTYTAQGEKKIFTNFPKPEGW